MTTPLASEPMPGDGQVPYMSTLVDRLFQRLPEIYRRMDATASSWPMKRYLGATLAYGGQIDDTIARIEGDRPVGPATPEPWALRPDELEQWRAARQSRPSAMADPDQADAAWLPWLAQLVGATLDPSANEAEQRDTIRYATSGWRGGTRRAIADAAKTALTGSRYARVVPHMKTIGGSLTSGTIWDLAVVTRISETPDPDAVLGAILRKGTKPAGVVLWHATYEATWDQVEAVYPIWTMWEAKTWDQLAETGLLFTPIPDNIVPNPSFETDTTGWTAGASAAVGRILGGVDGAAMGRVTTSAAVDGELSTPMMAGLTPGDYHFSFSVRPDQGRALRYEADFFSGGGITFLSTQVEAHPGPLPPDQWTRVGTNTALTVPPGANAMQVRVIVEGMANGELYDIDAFYARGI